MYSQLDLACINQWVPASEFTRIFSKIYRMSLWLYILIGIFALLVVSVVGCGNEPDLQETLSNSVRTTSEAQSYRSIQIMIQTSGDKETRYLSQAECMEPDRLREQSIENEGWTETVITGDKCYVRSSAQPTWHVFQGECKLTTLNDELEILYSLIDLEALPDVEINDVDCLHYSGEVDFNSYSSTVKTNKHMTPDTTDQLRNWEGEVDLWIAKNNFLIRKIKATLRWPEEGNDKEKLGGRISSIKYLYDFNGVDHIELPLIDE